MEKKSEKLTKSERISSEPRVEALFGDGRRGGVEPIRYCFRVSKVGIATDSDAGIETGVGVGVGVEVGAGVGVGVGATHEASVAVLFSVPKKAFRRAWKRNLIKRRLKESYRKRKHELVAKAEATGKRIDIALVCYGMGNRMKQQVVSDTKNPNGAHARTSGKARMQAQEQAVPNFKTIDNAVAKIIEQILERS